MDGADRREEGCVVEGNLAIGPEESFLIFVEGEGLGGLLLKRFPNSFDGDYYRLGRVRVTVERLREE
jgi:hypothetical protein